MLLLVGLHCAKSCSSCGSLSLSTNWSFLASAEGPIDARTPSLSGGPISLARGGTVKQPGETVGEKLIVVAALTHRTIPSQPIVATDLLSYFGCAFDGKTWSTTEKAQRPPAHSSRDRLTSAGTSSTSTASRRGLTMPRTSHWQSRRLTVNNVVPVNCAKSRRDSEISTWPSDFFPT